MKTKEQKDHRAIINEGQENEMELFGYRMSVPWIILCVIGYFISGGILLLLFNWKPEWSVWANCVPSSLEKANVVLLRTTDERKKYTRKKVRWLSLDAFVHLFQSGLQCSVISDKNSILNNAIRRPDLKVKFIRVQKIRYVWNFSQKKFDNIGSLEDEHSCFSIHSYYASGLTEEEQAIRKLVCGPNTIEVEVAPLWKLLIFKVLNALYIYQIAAIILMLAEKYLGYGLAILVLCICNITLLMIEHRKQSSKLHNLVKAHNNMKVTVYKRNGDLFVVVLIIETAFNIFFIFADFPSIYLNLELVCTPMSWRIHMLILLVVCLVVTFVVEEFILDNRALWVAMKRCLKMKPGSKYKKFHTILEEDKDWPPIGRTVNGNILTDVDAKIYINQSYEHDSALNSEEGCVNVH